MTALVFISSILLSLVAIGLLIGAVVSKRRRKLLLAAATIVLVYAGWLVVSSAGFLGGLFFVAGAVAVVGAAVLWAVHLIDRMKARMSRQPDRLTEGRRGVLGGIGVAVTPLRPTGTAEINGSRVAVSTEGEFIAAGSYVRVVAKDRKQYFVRLAEPSEVVGAVTGAVT